MTFKIVVIMRGITPYTEVWCSFLFRSWGNYCSFSWCTVTDYYKIITIWFDFSYELVQ